MTQQLLYTWQAWLYMIIGASLALQGPARARARARGPVLVGRDGARRAAGGGTRRRRVSRGRLMTGLGRHRQDWDDLAALDPYWSVLTEPGKRSADGTGRSSFARARRRSRA
jgi:hypothetical protein